MVSVKEQTFYIPLPFFAFQTNATCERELGTWPLSRAGSLTWKGVFYKCSQGSLQGRSHGETISPLSHSISRTRLLHFLLLTLTFSEGLQVLKVILSTAFFLNDTKPSLQARVLCATSPFIMGLQAAWEPISFSSQMHLGLWPQIEPSWWAGGLQECVYSLMLTRDAHRDKPSPESIASQLSAVLQGFLKDLTS